MYEDDPFRPPEPPKPTTPEPSRRTIWAWAYASSALMHLFLLAAFVTVTFRNGCIAIAIVPTETGKVGDEGEKGRSGAGGTEVEVALERPPADRISAGQPASPAAQEQPPQQEPEHPQAAQPATRQQAHAQERTTPDTHENEPAEAPPPAPAEPPASAHASRSSTPHEAIPAPPGGGTGSLLTNSGLRPGSIGQQRSLLPRAVHCDDEVAGTWRAQKYDPIYGDWMLATLYIHRGASNELHGSMVVHQWDGGPFSIRPPACGPDGFDFLVDERASGFANGSRVDFGAYSWRLREIRCNGILRTIDYHADHFTGVIDPAREEFQSVNNDGGRARNDPMVFRRIGCLDQTASPTGEGPAGDGGASPAP